MLEGKIGCGQKPFSRLVKHGNRQAELSQAPAGLADSTRSSEDEFLQQDLWDEMKDLLEALLVPDPSVTPEAEQS